MEAVDNDQERWYDILEKSQEVTNDESAAAAATLLLFLFFYFCLRGL